jgi:putative transposase
MNQPYAQEWPQFFTATIQDWKHLLKEAEYKNIIIETLQFLVVQERVTIHAFVIMSNHLHIIWQAKGNIPLKQVQNSFIRQTAKAFKEALQKEDKLKEYEVCKVDRKYNFWKRDSLGIELFSSAVFLQKLNYIHNNPVKAGLCSVPEDYYYSSALFYQSGVDNFGFVQHYMGD